MLLAPIATFLLGLALGYIKGFRRPKVTLKGVLSLVLVLGLPAILLSLSGADPAIGAILLSGFLVTYLSLQVGLLIGDRVGTWRRRRAS